jgi:NAD(P)-dependent dehydrogenase (short-subunit alcohol dehydrogenase family)
MDIIRTLTSLSASILYSTFHILIPLLPTHQQPHANYLLSLFASLLSLLFGRLLPALHPPMTDMRGKTALVTGANSGIGLEIARGLLERGARVVMGCRSVERGEGARADLLSAAGLRGLEGEEKVEGRVSVMELDTSDLESVHHCVARLREERVVVDVMVHNAGISTAPKGGEFSKQGFEIVYATNFLGGFLLTWLLLEQGMLSGEARMVLTSSHGQYGGKFGVFEGRRVTERRERGFHCPSEVAKGGEAAACYSNSKAMQCAFAKMAQKRFDGKASEGTRRVVHAFTPGFTRTAIFGKTGVDKWREEPGFMFLKATEAVLATNVRQGAATGVYLASAEDEDVVGRGKGGRYWDRMCAKPCSVDLLDEETLSRMWKRWEADAGIHWR